MFHNHHSQLDLINRNMFHESSSHNYKGGKQFPFLEGINSTLPGTSNYQPQLSANSSLSSQKICSNGLNRVIDSGCALSLLSSPPAETREIGFSNMLQSDSIPQFLIPSLNYSNQGMNGEPLQSALVTEISSNANHHNQGIFHMGPDGSSPSRTHQTLSFSWE